MWLCLGSNLISFNAILIRSDSDCELDQLGMVLRVQDWMKVSWEKSTIVLVHNAVAMNIKLTSKLLALC